MLKIESIKLPPGAGMAELTAAAARLLRVREKGLTDLRVLRRSVDAREDVALVYTVAAAVKDEGAVLRRCRSKKISRLEPPHIYTPPAPLPAPAVPRWWWARDRRGCLPRWCWPGRDCGPFCWSGERTWSGGRPT